MQKGLLIALMAVMMAVLVACGGDGDSGEPTAAEAAALAFAEAVLANEDDYLSENTCANVPSGSTSLDMYALFTIGMAVRESVAHSAADLDIDLQASTESEIGDEALIRIKGSATFPDDLRASELAPLPVEQTTNLDEVWRMRQEGGVWKWCGGTENEN